jgi:hypothetical protein
MRWLHIYLSMISLAIVLFFSVTGITLNHPDWFFAEAERSEQAEGVINLKWLQSQSTSQAAGAVAAEDADPSRQVLKLEVVEYLRTQHGIHGALAEFRVDDRECMVTFKGPGYTADAFIDRESGHYSLTQTEHGFIAMINDLHKGRDTGPIWSVVIDLSAALITLVSLTGLALLFYLKLRRVPGLVVALIGTIIFVSIYRMCVP